MTGRRSTSAIDRAVGPAQLLVGSAVSAALLSAVVALCTVLVPRDGRIEPASPGARAEVPVCEELEVELTTDQPPRVSSETLYACPLLFDGVRVRFEGEVVGGVLQRETDAWLQVNDDDYAGPRGPLPVHGLPLGANESLAVKVPLDAVADLRFVGSDRARGDTVSVTGEFRRADASDGGATNLVADEVSVLERGALIEPLTSPARSLVAAAAFLAAAVLAWAARRRQAP